MVGGPRFERGGTLIGGQPLPRCGHDRSFHHGQEVFLQSLSASLGLSEKSGFKFRFEMECDGHRVRCPSSLCQFHPTPELVVCPRESAISDMAA